MSEISSKSVIVKVLKDMKDRGADKELLRKCFREIAEEAELENIDQILTKSGLVDE